MLKIYNVEPRQLRNRLQARVAAEGGVGGKLEQALLYFVSIHHCVSVFVSDYVTLRHCAVK